MLVAIFAMAVAPANAADPANLNDLRREFVNPPNDAKIMMRWWWFGPSVTKIELEREMRLMKEAGIGGFEVQPVYPLEVDRNFPWLSDEFLDALKFTGAKARELGLRMDLTLGSGWPYGGPHIPITEAAGTLRVVRSATMPALGEGESLLAVFAGARRIDPQHLPGDEVQFFIASHTRQMVKRAAAGAEGFVLDHYDRKALEHHLQVAGEKMLKALGPNPPYAVFSDSLEVYGADWTANLPEEFRNRRGYDLIPYLPALIGTDMGEKTATVRHDWGQTLTELANENYLRPLQEWARAHGTRLRSQTYGIPPVTLSSNSLVDLPEGEGTQWRQFSATRWAASASHLYGRAVTSSETWTWLHSPVFRATPLDMKAEADIHFLQGVTQLVGHGWPYSPPEAGEPGWRFYAAAVFNQHNPWWPVMPDVTRYLQRVSYLLRQGKAANDVALYLPTDDAWSGFTHGALNTPSVNQSMDKLIGPLVIPQILDSGHDFDFIDDGAIEHSGIPYPVLILPGVERIPAATIARLREFVKKGGVIIATRRRPATSMSEFGEVIRFVADESLLGRELTAICAADVATAPEIGFVHRKLEFADVYFLANTSNHPVHTMSTFRVAGASAAWWDPFTGETAGASRGSRIDLDLDPYESRVLVFSRDNPVGKPPTNSTRPVTVDLSNDWGVTFPGSKTPVAMRTLRSWTEVEDRKYFSGSATYERTVEVPRAAADSGRQIYLKFGTGTPVVVGSEKRSGAGMRAWLEGPVREAAMVYVNGNFAGSVWRPPYEVRVSGLLHAGSNSIRVIVSNLAINALARGPLPDYEALTAKYGERFQAQDLNDLAPLPSGLLGPITLVTR